MRVVVVLPWRGPGPLMTTGLFTTTPVPPLTPGHTSGAAVAPNQPPHFQRGRRRRYKGRSTARVASLLKQRVNVTVAPPVHSVALSQHPMPHSPLMITVSLRTHRTTHYNISSCSRYYTALILGFSCHTLAPKVI